jgi:hypothetical protein
MIKGKVSHPITDHKRSEVEYRYRSAISLTSALNGVGGQRHALTVYPRERPGTHCIGGWVYPRTGLGFCGKYRPPPEFDLRTVQPVAGCYKG